MLTSNMDKGRKERSHERERENNGGREGSKEGGWREGGI